MAAMYSRATSRTTATSPPYDVSPDRQRFVMIRDGANAGGRGGEPVTTAEECNRVPRGSTDARSRLDKPAERIFLLQTDDGAMTGMRNVRS